MTISRLFSSLEGSWKLERTIVNEGKVLGVASFRRLSPHQLHYREDGQFHKTSGEIFTVFRDYVYACQEETISVYFYENPLRLFHTLQFQSPSVAYAVHECLRDRYESWYHFLHPNEFHISHTILKPDKQTFMNTVFRSGSG